MALMQSVKSTINVFAVREGDIILDGIPALVTKALPLGYGEDNTDPYEITVFVIDGNGERYMIRRTGGTFVKIHWSDDEWDAYRMI